MTVIFDDSYLNRTPNKEARPAPFHGFLGVVMHETAGYGSLDYNLNPGLRSSFNILNKRSGRLYRYVDEVNYISWGAGVGRSTAPYYGRSRYAYKNKIYIGNDVNRLFINIEIEGPNDGTPITVAQTESTVALLIYLSQKYGYPLDDENHREHAEIAEGYKTDAQGYSARLLVQMARNVIAGPQGTNPYGPYTVDPRLSPLWTALGGLGRPVTGLGWTPGPGWPIDAVRNAPDGNGYLQACERYYIGKDSNGAPRIPLALEVRAWGI